MSIEYYRKTMKYLMSHWHSTVKHHYCWCMLMPEILHQLVGALFSKNHPGQSPCTGAWLRGWVYKEADVPFVSCTNWALSHANLISKGGKYLCRYSVIFDDGLMIDVWAEENIGAWASWAKLRFRVSPAEAKWWMWCQICHGCVT